MKFIKPIAEVEKILPAHAAFLDKYYKEGRFLISGRMNPRVGGILLAKGSSMQEIKSIMATDPFFVEKIADFQFYEFLPSKSHEDFKKYLAL
jgi:uncharacterized protein YciI